jgi:hypothetical protein
MVTTEDGSVPTKETARPLGVNEAAWTRGDGRGSMVWFNQASMFQTAELGIPTVKEVIQQGLDATSDVDEWIEKKGIFKTVVAT